MTLHDREATPISSQTVVCNIFYVSVWSASRSTSTMDLHNQFLWKLKSHQITEWSCPLISYLQWIQLLLRFEPIFPLSLNKQQALRCLSGKAQQAREAMHIPSLKIINKSLAFQNSRSRSNNWQWQWWFLLGNHNHQENPHVHQQHIVWAQLTVSFQPVLTWFLLMVRFLGRSFASFRFTTKVKIRLSCGVPLSVMLTFIENDFWDSKFNLQKPPPYR